MLVWRRGGALLPRASRRLHSPGAAEVFMPAWRGRGTRPSVSRGSGRGPGACSARKHRGSANGCGRSTRRPRSATHQSSTATPCRHRPRRNRHERREPTSASPERQSPAGHRAGRSQRRPNVARPRPPACSSAASTPSSRTCGWSPLRSPGLRGRERESSRGDPVSRRPRLGRLRRAARIARSLAWRRRSDPQQAVEDLSEKSARRLLATAESANRLRRRLLQCRWSSSPALARDEAAPAAQKRQRSSRCRL